MATPPTLQTYQGFPKLDAGFVNPDLTITIPWYRFIVSIWRKTGGSSVPTNAEILYDLSPGAAEGMLSPISSPFVFQAPIIGFLTSAGGKVELNRSGTWREVSLAGGSFWLMTGDQARVSWFSNDPPEVVWWPAQ